MDVTFRVTKPNKKKHKKIVRTVLYISDSSDDQSDKVTDESNENKKKIKIN